MDFIWESALDAKKSKSVYSIIGATFAREMMTVDNDDALSLGVSKFALEYLQQSHANRASLIKGMVATALRHERLDCVQSILNIFFKVLLNHGEKKETLARLVEESIISSYGETSIFILRHDLFAFLPYIARILKGKVNLSFWFNTFCYYMTPSDDYVSAFLHAFSFLKGRKIDMTSDKAPMKNTSAFPCMPAISYDEDRKIATIIRLFRTIGILNFLEVYQMALKSRAKIANFFRITGYRRLEKMLWENSDSKFWVFEDADADEESLFFSGKKAKILRMTEQKAWVCIDNRRYVVDNCQFDLSVRQGAQDSSDEIWIAMDMI